MSEKELDSSINNYIEVKSNNIKQLDWDMAIGMAARGLKWIGLGW